MATNKLALIRLRRATRPAMRRVPVQPHPDNIARDYYRELRPLVAQMHAITIAHVLPLFTHTDAATLGRGIDGARVDTHRVINRERANLLAQGIGGKVRRFTENAVGAQVKAVIGVNPLLTMHPLSSALVDDFAIANANLIVTVADRYFDQITSVVQNAVATGERAEDVSRDLQSRFAVAETNADRIARDQVSKLNAAITETRHRDLGVDAYYWRTSNDERVRDTHVANEGQRFTYDNPPATTGNPGEDIQCRCRAEPDLSAFFS